MIKTLFISHDAALYGAPKSMVNIIDGLQGKADFIVLLPYKGGISIELEKRGIHYVSSRYFWDVYNLSSLKDFISFPFRFFRHYISLFKTLIVIRKLHRKHKFDLIHTNSGVVRVGYYASKILNIPHVWHIREFQTKDYSLNILYGKKHFIKLLNRTDKIICVSNAIKDYFNLQDNSVIYNGVMPEPSNQILCEKENYFIFAGSLLLQKGIFDVLSSFIKFSKSNSSIQLVICGTGSVENTNKINNIINAAGLKSRVKLYGYRTDVLDLLMKAKACIVSSYHEAFGRITAEAMLMGCLVIGNSSEGTLEIIKDEKYGFLYFNENELVSAMLFTADPINDEIINSKIAAARERAIELFTQEKLCKNIDAVYNNIITNKTKINEVTK
jgi:glycosyltransferase involved in cell wall biosynthesis